MHFDWHSSYVILVLANSIVLTSSVVCSAGTFRHGATCQACPVGKHSVDRDSLSCFSCSFGSETPQGATACCPSDDATWRIAEPGALQMPPGKYSTSVFVIDFCPESAPSTDADVLQSRIQVKAVGSSVAPQFFNGSVHVATIHLGKYVQSCQTFQCDKASCGVVPPEKVLLTPDDFVSIQARVLLFDGSEHTCVQNARVGLEGYGCKDGTVYAFFTALVLIVTGTLMFGVIFEYFFQHRYDIFVEASLRVFSGRSCSNASTASIDANSPSQPLPHLPDLQELHADVKGALSLEDRDLPLANLRGWSTLRQEDQQPLAVNVEFRIPTQSANEFQLRQKLLSFAWKPGPGWALDALTVEQHSPMRRTEKGKLPGADLMDAVEDAILTCLNGCRLSVNDANSMQLQLDAARNLLSQLLTKQMAVAMSIQYIIHLAAIIVLPAYAATIMECENGYPRGVHVAWGIFAVVSCSTSNWVLIRPMLPFFRGAPVLKHYVSRFGLRLVLRFLGMLVSITDLYQDTSFPVIAGRCGFDLWWVSVWLCVFGIGVMQVLVQVILLYKSYSRYRRARTAEERDRILVEGMLLALRGCDNHVLVYAVRPAVEERLGGHSSWAMKTVEARVAFLRFIFEDAEQSALQVIFLYWFESASLFDKMWVGISTATSLCLSFTITVQTLPEVRDWIWHRFLLNFPGAIARYSVRYFWLFLVVAVYRLLTILPWLGLCVPARERNGGVGSLKRLLLLDGLPHSSIVGEAFTTVFLSVVVCMLVSGILSIIWGGTLGVAQRWREWRGSSPHWHQRSGPAYNKSARFVLDSQIHVKTEQDEDTWLESLRKLDGLGGAFKYSEVLIEIDWNVFQLVHVMGIHGLAFDAQKKHVQTLLLSLQSGVSMSSAPAISEEMKRLQVQIDSNIKCAEVRRAALELLATDSFRHVGLIQKAQLIEHATCGKFPLRLLHWSVIQKLGELPVYGNGPDCAEGINFAFQRRNKSAKAESSMIIVYLSHQWSRRNHPDTEGRLKAKSLVQFAKWLIACSAMKRIDCEVWFWIDYCCMDTSGSNFEVGLAALPLFVAACSDILTWRSPGCDHRCWTMVERLLAYSFCPGGLTPYAIDEHSFAGCTFAFDAVSSQLSHDFSKPYAELANIKSSLSKIVPVDHTDARMPDVHRYERKLADPLDSMASRPSDTPIASTQRRHLQRLVDMALAVPALEVFHDRQPVVFGLTSVVELFLSSQAVLCGQKKFHAPRSFKDDASEYGTWLQATPREIGIVSDWKLVVELPKQTGKLEKDSNFAFRPGDDEGVIVLVDRTGDNDVLGPRPDPEEIEKLFMDVGSAYEGHLQGITDGSALEKASSRLAYALKTDLRHAVASNDEEQLRKALMRSGDVQLPSKVRAIVRFCEVQLKNAIATEDLVNLQMALRYAIQESLVDLPEYRDAVAALTQLQIKQLRDNALSVVRQDDAGVPAVVSVIGVAKQRGWDDIAAEALAVLKSKKFLQPGVVQMMYNGEKLNQPVGIANLIKAHRLGSEYCIHGVLSLTQEELTKRLEDLSKRDDAQGLANLYIAADSEACVDICRNVLSEFQFVIDRWSDLCKEADKDVRAQLQTVAMSVTTFGAIALSDIADLALSDVRQVEQHKRDEASQKISSKTIDGIVDAIAVSHKWGWESTLYEASAAFKTMIDERNFQVGRLGEIETSVVVACVVELSTIYDACLEHQLLDVATHAEQAFQDLLSKGKAAKEPVLLIEMSHAALTSGCSVFAGYTRLALNDVIIALRASDDPAAKEKLCQLQDKATEYGYPGLIELAGEAIGFVAQREEEHRIEAQAILAETSDIASAIEVWSKANRRGWTALAEEAEFKVKEGLKQLFENRTLDALAVLAQAAKSAKDHHMHGLHKTIQENLDFNVRAFQVDTDIEGLLRMIHVGAAVDSARKALQGIVDTWRKGTSAQFPYLDVLAFISNNFDETWFAEDIKRIATIQKKLVDAMSSSDIVELIEVLQDSRREGCIGFFKEASANLTSIFQKWKSEGDVGQIQIFLEIAHPLQHKDGVSQVLPAMVQACSPILDLNRKLHSFVSENEKGYSIDAVELVHLVSDLDTMGCFALVTQARELAKLSVRRYDMSDDADRNTLQKVHDAARGAHLDDIADSVVNVVGGSLPNEWRAKREGKLSLLEKTPSKDKELIDRIQKMMNVTYRGWGKMGRDCATRDRHKLGNPQGSSIQVESVVHVENAGNYLNYIKRRAEIEEQVRIQGRGRHLNIRTWEVTMEGLWRHPEDPVDSTLNECWLWHGSSEAGVNGITDTDFDLARAGAVAGTMFGRGLYFTESCLKADEYAQADERGFAPVLLCRVMLGRVNYCDHKSPWTIADTLEAACKGGRFDSVLGDREKVRGTFREFVVFDNNQVYPEYIVWYSRQPPFK